jgi:hypothetical protein
MTKTCERCGTNPMDLNFNGRDLCMNCVREVYLESEKEFSRTSKFPKYRDRS